MKFGKWFSGRVEVSEGLKSFLSDYNGERVNERAFIVNVSDLLKDDVIEYLKDSVDDRVGVYGFIELKESGGTYVVDNVQLDYGDAESDVLFEGYLKRQVLDKINSYVA